MKSLGCFCGRSQLSSLLYGDSAGSAGITVAVRWSVLKHLSSFPIDEVDEEALASPKHDFFYDWFNCALFSYDALFHYSLPANPFIQHTNNPVSGDLGRLQVPSKLVAANISVRF